jgi:hypothetical protein
MTLEVTPEEAEKLAQEIADSTGEEQSRIGYGDILCRFFLTSTLVLHSLLLYVSAGK